LNEGSYGNPEIYSEAASLFNRFAGLRERHLFNCASLFASVIFISKDNISL